MDEQKKKKKKIETAQLAWLALILTPAMGTTRTWRVMTASLESRKALRGLSDGAGRIGNACAILRSSSLRKSKGGPLEEEWNQREGEWEARS